MEQLDYNLLFQWFVGLNFVGLNVDDAIWDVTVFTKNRERLLHADIAEAFFQAVLQQAREPSLLSNEHFSVDGTLRAAIQGAVSLEPTKSMCRTSQSLGRIAGGAGKYRAVPHIRSDERFWRHVG